MDFLVRAHEERAAAISGRLTRGWDPAAVRKMPPPIIVRRYDQSQLDYFEAKIADVDSNGMSCPRCNAWAPLVSTLAALQDLAALLDGKIESEIRTWDCGICGHFRWQPADDGHRTTGNFVYERDERG